MGDLAPAQLSERERQVAERYVEGQSHKEIARALGISPATVRTHANAVYRKLEVTSRIELLHRLQPQPAAARAPSRRLLAILCADVVGYSRLIERDEAATVAALRAVRAEVIEPLHLQHHGQIAQYSGDGILSLFESVVDAVGCAAAVQRAMAERSAGLEDQERLVLRIAVNLGDVALVGGDVYGDGVNIAARLEQLCEPGGVLVSGTAYDHLHGRLDLAFAALGEQQVKNIARPVRVYRLAAGDSRASSGPAPSLPDKPSLAVLPFDNLCGEPGQEYFVDGMVEEITTALSKISGLFVIARNSSFTYKGRAVDVKQVGRELGVRYVLEGSVRKAGERVRITAQLINTGTSAHLWADRFDGLLADIFALQDDVAMSVAGVIEPTLRTAEIERARRKPTDSLDAYDLYLRALPLMLTLEPEQNADAIGLLDRALALDPNYALVHALKAWCHSDRCFRNWEGTDATAERNSAVRAARRALALGSDDATALAMAGDIIVMHDHDLDSGLDALRRSLALNPNSAIALSFGAWVACFAGDYAKAVECAEQALRLSPLAQIRDLPLIALAYARFLAGQPELAIEPAARAIAASPMFELPYCAMIASQVALGLYHDARATAAKLLIAAPRFRIAKRRIALFRDADRYAEFLAALERVGLPE